MLEKKDYVYGVIITYVFLVMLFFAMQEEYKVVNPCTSDEPCVRFCCQNNSMCTDTFIRKNFNGSLVKYGDEDQKDFIILHGKPKCLNIEINAKDVTTDRLEFITSGKIHFDSSYYGNQDYCFEENVDDHKTWHLFLCEFRISWNYSVHVFLSFVTLLLLSAIFLTYVYFADLRKTVGGKSFTIFILSYIILFSGMLFEHFEVHRRFTKYVVTAGFELSFMLMTLLNFDVWFSLRNPQTSQDDPKRFKIYCFIAFGTVAFFFAFEMLDYMLDIYFRSIFVIVEYLFFFMRILDVVFLSLAGWIIRKSSKADNKDVKFLVEKERFWMYLELYAVMFVAWSVVITLMFLSSTSGLFVADIIFSFSAANLFCIFVLNKDAKKILSDRYKLLGSN